MFEGCRIQNISIVFLQIAGNNWFVNVMIRASNEINSFYQKQTLFLLKLLLTAIFFTIIPHSPNLKAKLSILKFHTKPICKEKSNRKLLLQHSI